MLELAKLIDLIVGFASPVVQSKLQRSELVIKLLKQLNLDPEHPPTDFTAVYQYTLVEYGIGKPKPVLEMFRQAEIQAIFRKALDQNNPSLLLKEGETFLSGHSLGNQIQALGIDARQEFYQFAAVFIEVSKRTRTPAEVLTNQRLESLHRQISSIQDRLHRLPTLEAMRTEMARLAAQSYPMVPEANTTPALAQERQLQERQCRAFALAQQMKGWFETLGYRFEPYEVWQDDYFEWMIDIPVRRGRYDRILVRGIDGEAGLGDIRALRQSVETQRADEGWLVTARRISRAVREEVEKEENHDLGCYTLDELLDQDADFGGYLDWLESEIQRRGIDQKYVPLACTKEEIDPDTKQRIGMSRYDDRDGWIDGYIDLWLDDPAKEHISVLGEFGTGKTWFAFHYASQALTRYREAQKRGVERPRLPLVIPLRDYAKAVSVESLFSEFFFRKHEVRSLTYSAFEQLNRMGKLLLIFDGFDEMAARVDRQEMINNFWELAKVVVPGAKVILTCRTEHFPEAREGRALLNAQLQASTANLTGEMPQFEVLELEKFDDEQIRQVLLLQAEITTVEQVMSNPQLLDLARRPVMTELILEALPDIEAGKPVDMSRVYLYAVRRKMERDIKEERTFTSLADKLYFLCELSWEMLSSDRMSLNYREFPDRIRRLFGSVVQKEKDLDHWHYDMMGQTMLIRNADGDYTPAHRSLLEFFVAYKFAAELGVLSSDFLELAQTQSDIDIALEPHEYRWSEYFSQRDSRIAPLKEFVSERLEVLRLGFGHTSLPKAILDLLSPMVKGTDILIQHLISTKNKNVSQVGFIGGNSANIVTAIDKSSLEGLDLSKSVISGADFSKSSLRMLNLIDANLNGIKLRVDLARIWSISLSPDNKLLAIGSTNGVHIWKLSDNSENTILSGYDTDFCRSVLFSPNGELLVSGHQSGEIKLWDVQTGVCLKTFQVCSEPVWSIAFNRKGTVLASGEGDGSITLWDIENSKCLKKLEKHDKCVLAVAWNHDANTIASGSADGTICIWDAASGSCLQNLTAHTGDINSVSFSSDFKLLGSGGDDGTVKVWSTDTYKLLQAMQSHSSGVSCVRFSPNNQIITSGGYDNRVNFWKIKTNELTSWKLNDYVRNLCFHSLENQLFTASDEPKAALWNIDTKECLSSCSGHDSWIWSLASSPNDSVIAYTDNDWNIAFLDLKLMQHRNILFGHQGIITSIQYHPQGHYLASASVDGSVKLWDLKTLKSYTLTQKNSSSHAHVAFSPNGSLLAMVGHDENITVWNVATREKNMVILTGHSKRLSFLTFNTDGDLIASIQHTSIDLWSTITGRYVKTFHAPSELCSIAIAKGNEEILSAGSINGEVYLWSIETGELLKVVQQHSSYVTSIKFIRKKQCLVSCGSDKTVKFWDLLKGENIHTINTNTLVGSISVDKEEATIAVSGRSGNIVFWDLETYELLKTFVNRPYEGMNITGVKGLTEAEKATLKALGAIEN